VSPAGATWVKEVAVMIDVNLAAVAVAAIAVFVVSTVWYSAFGRQLQQLSPAYADAASNARPPIWKMGVEILRGLVVAAVLAGLAGQLEVTDWREGALLGFTLWIGFPVVLWTGAVMWEKVPLKLATIHAGDWLLKLVVIGILVSVWS
jgi:Protein of unknown function (DUF1761)